MGHGRHNLSSFSMSSTLWDFLSCSEWAKMHLLPNLKGVK